MSKKMTYEEFLSKAIEVHDNNYIYDENTKKHFKSSHSVIPIVCPIHGVFWQQARLHVNNGYGCNKCAVENKAKAQRKTTEKFIEDANKIHGDKYNYSKVVYVNAKTKVCIICPIHGEFWQIPNDHLSGKGCPNCNSSKLEGRLKKIFEKNAIDYEYRKHFTWLGRQELDFYIPSINLGIECQGKQHFGYGGWNENYNFDNLFKLDEKKNKLSKDNGVKLLYFAEKSFINDNIPSFYNKDEIFVDEKQIINEINYMLSV